MRCRVDLEMLDVTADDVVDELEDDGTEAGGDGAGNGAGNGAGGAGGDGCFEVTETKWDGAGATDGA